MATKTNTSGTNGHVNRIAEMAEPQTPTIMIPRPNIQTFEAPVVGVTPLITHRWSKKAIEMIEAKGQKKAKGPKDAKNPEAEYNAARYISTEGWDGVPATAFKAAMVGAARQCDGLTMTEAKRLFFVEPDGYDDENNGLVRIFGEPQMHRAMVRVGMGVADVRYRPIYTPWRAVVKVRFNAGVISADQVVNLIQLAGMSEGICEHRPSSPKSATGTFGCFQIEE